jgi:hypothetical protein
VVYDELDAMVPTAAKAVYMTINAAEARIASQPRLDGGLVASFGEATSVSLLRRRYDTPRKCDWMAVAASSSVYAMTIKLSMEETDRLSKSGIAACIFGP